MSLTVTPHSGFYLSSHALAPVSINFSTTGGMAPYFYWISSGELPSGLTLNQHTGVLSGTPTGVRDNSFVPAKGFEYRFDMRVQDSSNPYQFLVDTYTYTVLPPRVTMGPYAPILFQSEYIVPTNSKDNTIEIKSANFPSEYELITPPEHGIVEINRTEITYTPEEEYTGIDEFTIVATNKGGISNDITLEIRIAPKPPVVVPTEPQDIVINSVNRPIDIHASGIIDSITIGDEPKNGTVYIGGTTAFYTPDPNYTGPDSFTFVVSNFGGNVITKVDLTIEIPIINASPDSGNLPNGVINRTYSPITLKSSGGTLPHTVTIIKGEIPKGITFTPTSIYGTPIETGEYNFTVAFIDNSFPSHYNTYRDYQIKVYPTDNFNNFQWLTFHGKLFTATVGCSITYRLIASDSAATYSLHLGELPGGLTLSTDGTISGTPTAVDTATSYRFVVRATNPAKVVTDNTFIIDVNPATN